MDQVGSLVASRAWREGRVIDAHVTLDEIPGVVRNQDLVWIDLLDPTSEELAAVVAELGISSHAVEDALAPFERPKAIRHETYTFFTVYSTQLAPSDGEDAQERLRHSRISGIVMPTALVTIRLDDGFAMSEVLERWADNSDLIAHGSGALLHGLLDVIVDGHFDTIQQLDDIVDDLEDRLFENSVPGGAFAKSVFELRKDLVQLRRLVLPMREVVNVLRHGEAVPAELELWYDDLYDHVLRASEWTESIRDMVTTLFETNLSLQDARLNEIMKKLAAWAAVIAVPTAITGWFGQNLPYPGFAHVSGLWLSILLILAVSGSLWLTFRRKGWL